MKTETECIAEIILQIRDKASEQIVNHYDEEFYNGKRAFAKELLEILEEPQRELAKKIKSTFGE